MGGQFLDLMGDTAVVREDIELMGTPRTRENPVHTLFILPSSLLTNANLGQTKRIMEMNILLL